MSMNFDLTPVEKIGNYYFKREDMFIPFTESNVNGSKSRQCILLFKKNIELIKYGVITCASINSPQAPIIAQVAKYFNVPCTIFYGGTTYERLDKLPYPSLSKKLGANIQIVSKSGRTSVLQSKINERIKSTNEFVIKYGFDMKNNIDCFINSVANQVSNLPSNLDNLVITCGSSITLVGVLLGIHMFNKNISNIYAIGVAPNRTTKIINYINIVNAEFNLNISIDSVKYVDAFNELKGYKYENTMKEKYENIVFHPRYEAKSFNWLKQNIDINEKTCMWITGSDIFNK